MKIKKSVESLTILKRWYQRFHYTHKSAFGLKKC